VQICKLFLLTVVSFVAEKLYNGTIAGNWTIDSIEDAGVSMNGFSHGPVRVYI
jgi:hypothetical protein